MKSNTVFNTELYSLSKFHAKRIFLQDMPIIWQKVVFKKNEVKHNFQTGSWIFWADFMQNGFFSKTSLKFGKRQFLAQNEVKHSFPQRVVFLEQISCKRHFLARYAYNSEKVVFNTKWSQTQFWNSELYFLSRFHAKRIFLARHA